MIVCATCPHPAKCRAGQRCAGAVMRTPPREDVPSALSLQEQLTRFAAFHAREMAAIEERLARLERRQAAP